MKVEKLSLINFNKDLFEKYNQKHQAKNKRQTKIIAEFWVAGKIFKILITQTAYPKISTPVTFERQNPLSLKDENKCEHNG